MEAYYYNKMSKLHQNVYHLLLEGFLDLKKEILIPRVEGKELHDIFFRLRLDHPEIFWAVTYQYKYYKESPNLIFVPEYLFPKAKVQEHQKAMQSRVEKLARPARELSDRDKEKYIHDFICSNVTYDKLKKPYSHEIIGPLGQGVGVCEGIAKSVKVLCDALGVWCIIGFAGNNPDKGIKYGHTWNILKIDGKYYHLDATFDNSLGKGEEIRYDYFNLNDEKVFRDHEPLQTPAPTCGDAKGFYYLTSKMSFTKPEDVYKRSLQAAKKGKTLTFHWRGGYLTRELVTEFVGMMKEAGEKKGLVPSVRINWGQSVLRVSYRPAENQAAQEPEVLMQQANEGEEISEGVTE